MKNPSRFWNHDLKSGQGNIKLDNLRSPVPLGGYKRLTLSHVQGRNIESIKQTRKKCAHLSWNIDEFSRAHSARYLPALK